MNGLNRIFCVICGLVVISLMITACPAAAPAPAAGVAVGEAPAAAETTVGEGEAEVIKTPTPRPTSAPPFSIRNSCATTAQKVPPDASKLSNDDKYPVYWVFSLNFDEAAKAANETANTDFDVTGYSINGCLTLFVRQGDSYQAITDTKKAANCHATSNTVSFNFYDTGQGILGAASLSGGGHITCTIDLATEILTPLTIFSGGSTVNLSGDNNNLTYSYTQFAIWSLTSNVGFCLNPDICPLPDASSEHVIPLVNYSNGDLGNITLDLQPKEWVESNTYWFLASMKKYLHCNLTDSFVDVVQQHYFGWYIKDKNFIHSFDKVDCLTPPPSTDQLKNVPFWTGPAKLIIGDDLLTGEIYEVIIDPGGSVIPPK